MKSLINPNLIFNKLEKFLPKTEEYTTYWREEYRKIIEGIWIGNCFVSGPMYFYANYWTIEAKGVYTNPSIRDVEWLLFYTFEEARGFSGFEGDLEYHCDFNLKELQRTTKHGEFITHEDKRIYLTPKEYLEKFHKSSLGRPLYNNQCKNIISIGCRGFGKTKLSAGLTAYNFITDGIKDIKKWKETKERMYEELGYDTSFPMKSNTVISSIDSKYSNKIVDDFWIGYEKIRGGQTYNNVKYPSPLVKAYTGSLKAGGGGLKAEFEIKQDSGWEKLGSGSFIKHVTFFNKPEAANGHRSSLICVDEIGFHNNLKQTMGQLKNCTQVEGDKFGVILLFGTSGDMGVGGASFEAKYIFENPEEYNCIALDDLWENKNRKIGIFVPRWMVLGYKDEFGNTVESKAKGAWEILYEEAKKSSDVNVLDMFLMNDPALPSHAFLNKNGSNYPIALLQEQLDSLDILPKSEYSKLAIKGSLDADHLDNITFKPDLDNKFRDCDYPIEKDNKKGCITIYEMPDIKAEPFTYVAGLDPIGTEGVASEIQSDSIASCVIVRRGLFGKKIVAEYAGRETELNDTNEIMRRLLVFYNAHCLYENNYNNFKLYLQGKLQLHYLAKTPNVLKASVGRSDSYGLHATKDGNKEMVKHSSDWLLSKAPNGEMTLKGINSKSILKELISAGDGVNTDRETALKLAVVLCLQLDLNVKKEETSNDWGSWFNKRYDKGGNLIRR